MDLMRSARIEVSAAGITRTSRRSRSMPAASIRRIYLYTDANGDDCLVARGSGLRLQFISRRELLEPAVRLGATALIDAVRADAQVDDDVPAYLARLSTH